MQQGQAARHGVLIRDWIEDTREELGAGFKGLEFALENFKVAQIRFNKQAFGS